MAVAVASVTPLVETFQEMMGGCLEVRLGCTSPAGEWKAGVSEESFNEILSMFLNYESWEDASEGWHDLHEYAYTLSDGARVRTRVGLSSRMTVSHVIKHHVSRVELRMRNHGRARVGLRKEMVVDGKLLPETVTPHMACVKKQRSFTRGAWRFSLARVWRGGSRSASEEAQACKRCSYEVEIEFVPPGEYWDNPRHTPTYVSTSLLMKMVDVLSDEMIGCDVVDAK
jgi:hypothetical protein